jgi:transcriptional regulator with XRE-family HTH domain
MGLKPNESPTLRNLGSFLTAARRERGLSQAELAARCALSQEQISYFELGQRRPTLDQLVRIGSVLDSSIQRLITGSDRPGTRLPDIAIELRHLGIADLWIGDAIVPGAFRPAEELIAHAVSGTDPDPRILEAIPAVLAWNDLDPILLRAYSLTTRPRTTRRLAWLADIALAIDRRGGFPGGCKKEQLARFIRMVYAKAPRVDIWDNLGRPTTRQPTSPIWKRWKISYESDLAMFEQRATHLHELRSQLSGHRGRRVRVYVFLDERVPDGALGDTGHIAPKTPASVPTEFSRRSTVARTRSTRRKKSDGGKRDGAR